MTALPAAPAPAATHPTPRRRRSRARLAEPPRPLGSLTQREHRGGVHCRSCGSGRVTRLSMNLTDGTPVDFTSCHRCEHRTWESTADGVLPVATVLDRTRR